MQEQKVILYLISKIKPEDIDLKEHIFEIRDFCEVCGLDYDNGANYRYIKQTMKDLRDKSIWVTLADGSETTLSWLNKVKLNRNTGSVAVRLDDDMKPYLLDLQIKFTEYDLIYVLAMSSKYGIKLYELLKSYEWEHKNRVFDIDDLKRLLLAENYARFPDFKRYVLDIAMREINEYSDISVKYEVIKVGRKYGKIEFEMKLKRDTDERLKTWARIDEAINPAQMSLFEKVYGVKYEND
jgi:plasmid replication initiation protein